MEKAARATRPAEQQQQRSPPAAAARAGSSKPGHADDSHILRKEDLKEAVLTYLLKYTRYMYINDPLTATKANTHTHTDKALQHASALERA